MESSVAVRKRMHRYFYTAVISSLIIIFAGWWATSGHLLTNASNRLIAIGDFFGLLAAWSVVLQIILMSRIPFVERYFDLHDNIQLHQWNGYALLGSISGHVIFLTIGYALPAHASWLNQFIIFNLTFSNVLEASIGTVIFFGASALSLKLVRSKMRYELWYLSHLTIYFGILLTFLHQISTGRDFIGHFWFTAFWYGFYGLAFVLWARYRVIGMFVIAFKHRLKVESIIETARNTYIVTLTGRQLSRFTFVPGQYATWRILSVGLWFEAHPFSISSPPGTDRLKFTVKASEAYTKKLLKVKPGTPVLMDGPRGSFTHERADEVPHVVLVAGGIGVSPYLSTIEELLRGHSTVTLLYGVRSEEDIAFRKELIDLQARGLKVVVYRSDKGQSITGESLSPYINKDTVIYVCGPDTMSHSIHQQLRSMGVKERRIIAERFAF